MSVARKKFTRRKILQNLARAPWLNRAMPEETPREATSDEVIARLTEELKRAQLEIGDLRAKIDQLLRRLFGAQSEGLDPAELQMLLKGIIEPPKSPEPVAARVPKTFGIEGPILSA